MNASPQICTSFPVRTFCSPLTWTFLTIFLLEQNSLLFSVASVAEGYTPCLWPFWHTFITTIRMLKLSTSIQSLMFGQKCPGIVVLACKRILQMLAWKMYFTFKEGYLRRASLSFVSPRCYQVGTSQGNGRTSTLPQSAGGLEVSALPHPHCSPENASSRITKGCFLSRVTKSQSSSLFF